MPVGVGARQRGPEERALERLKLHEGLSLRKYPDGRPGRFSIAYGRHDRADFKCPETCTKAEAEAWLIEDWNVARADAALLMTQWGLALNPVRQFVLVEAAYQLGRPTLSKFRRMLTALQKGNFGRAADEMLWSNPDDRNPRATPWHKQTPGRVRLLAAILRVGSDQAER